MKKRQITIKDIANKLNISKSTVSRALHNSIDISLETKQLVLEMVQKLDYRPNNAAKSLQRGKSNIIGVVIPSFSIPFYAKVISAIHDAALLQGFQIMVCQSNENFELEKQYLDLLIGNFVDGILLSVSKQTEDYEHIRKIQEKGIPVVLFNRIIADSSFSKVCVNDYQGSFDAVEYLAQKYSRIAFISGPANLYISVERKRGYIDALQKNKLEYREEWIEESDFSIESGYNCAAALLEKNQGIDAFFCICDEVAFGVISYLHSINKAIPDEIGVCGFTDEPVAGLINPPLTTIAQPISEIGEKSVNLLIENIRYGIAHLTPRTIVIEPNLITRNSA